MCSRLNIIYKFYQRFQANENNVYTERGESVFKNIIRYELQKMLFKLDHVEDHLSTDFEYDVQRFDYVNEEYVMVDMGDSPSITFFIDHKINPHMKYSFVEQIVIAAIVKNQFKLSQQLFQKFITIGHYLCVSYNIPNNFRYFKQILKLLTEKKIITIVQETDKTPQLYTQK
eukprot:XP_001952391.1 PREDICTED: uncharacterized protein LOC100162289 [Acyrthosiphon pisum]